MLNNVNNKETNDLKKRLDEADKKIQKLTAVVKGMYIDINKLKTMMRATSHNNQSNNQPIKNNNGLNI